MGDSHSDHFRPLLKATNHTFFHLRVPLKDLDDNSYEKRIENIEKGKSYLKSNGFFKSKSNLFEDIQRFIYKR